MLFCPATSLNTEWYEYSMYFAVDAAELELLMQPGQVDTYGCHTGAVGKTGSNEVKSLPISTGLHCPLLHMAELRNEHRPSPSL